MFFSSKSAFALRHEATGELSSVRLPSGHRHTFRVTPLIGRVAFTYSAPWNVDGEAYTVVYGSKDSASTVVINPDGTIMTRLCYNEPSLGL